MDWNADPTILYRSINRIILVCNSVDCVRDFLDVRIVASIEEYSIYSIVRRGRTELEMSSFLGEHGVIPMETDNQKN